MKIGIDIVYIPKIGETIKRWGDKFLNRVFSEEEIMFCRKRKDSITCFAGRFAAKEAVYKTLGKTISLKSISILSGGRPVVVINGEIARKIILSISHHGEYAIAVAVNYSSFFT